MKTLSCWCIASLFTFSLAAQGSDPCDASAAHTDCSNPYEVSLLNSWYSGNGASSFPACGITNTGGEYWVKINIAPMADSFEIYATVNYNGGQHMDDPGFEVYELTSSGNCPTSQPVLSLDTCINSSNGTDEYYVAAVPASSALYVRFFDADGSIGGGGSGPKFKYCVHQIVPGETACNAIDVSLPFTYTGTTTNMLDNHQGGCRGKEEEVDGLGPDVFFKYDSPGDEWITLNLSGTLASNNTELAILTPKDSCNGQFTCYDSLSLDANGTFHGGIQAAVGEEEAHCRSIYLDSARIYYFIVDTDSSNQSGPYTVNIENHYPDNGDDCNTAFSMGPNINYYFDNNNCDYTAGPNDPDYSLLCAGSIENTHWASFTSTNVVQNITVAVSNIYCDYYDYSPIYNLPGWQFGLVTGSCGGPYSSVQCSSGITPYNQTSVTFSFTPTPNTTYYFVMDGNAGSECTWNISLSGGVKLLPVTMLNFEVTEEQGNALVEWKVAHEEENQYYDLEYSSNGMDFYALSRFPSKEATDVPVTYSYLHKNPPSILNYYRLKQVDLNGNWNYLPIRILELPEKNRTAINIYPVPATQKLNLEIQSTGSRQARIKLISGSGITVWRKTVEVSPGHGMQIPVHHCPPGIYVLEVQKADGIERHQIIIQ